MSDAIAKYKVIFHKTVGEIDPRPTLFVVREGLGVELQIRDRDMRSVVLSLGPVEQVEGALFRGEVTGVDVMEGEVDDDNRVWVDAALAALPEVEADSRWSRYLARVHRRGLRRRRA